MRCVRSLLFEKRYKFDVTELLRSYYDMAFIKTIVKEDSIEQMLEAVTLFLLGCVVSLVFRSWVIVFELRIRFHFVCDLMNDSVIYSFTVAKRAQRAANEKHMQEKR